MWVWSTQTHYSQDRGKGCWWQWLMLYSFVLPRDHIWSQWRFVLIMPSILSGALWLLLTSFSCYKKDILKTNKIFSVWIPCCSGYCWNLHETLDMANAKYCFPLISRRKISPQNPIMLATGSHLFKGKNSIHKLPGQCMQLLHPCIKPADCAYQIGVVMQS